MTKRFSIVVREHGANHDVELMQCDSNPQAIVDGLREKKLTIRRSLFEPGKRVVKIPKYISVRVIDHGRDQG